jgi:hypothetical protein
MSKILCQTPFNEKGLYVIATLRDFRMRTCGIILTMTLFVIVTIFYRPLSCMH